MINNQTTSYEHSFQKITFWNGKSLLGLILSCQNECKLISKLLFYPPLRKMFFLVSYLRSFQYLALIHFISLRFDNSCLFSFCGKIILVGVLSLVALLRASFLWCDRTTQQNLKNYYLINRLFSHFHHYQIRSNKYYLINIR